MIHSETKQFLCSPVGTRHLSLDVSYNSSDLTTELTGHSRGPLIYQDNITAPVSKVVWYFIAQRTEDASFTVANKNIEQNLLVSVGLLGSSGAFLHSSPEPGRCRVVNRTCPDPFFGQLSMFNWQWSPSVREITLIGLANQCNWNWAGKSLAKLKKLFKIIHLLSEIFLPLFRELN